MGVHRTNNWLMPSMTALASACLASCSTVTPPATLAGQGESAIGATSCTAFASLKGNGAPVTGLIIGSAQWHEAGLVLTSPRGEKTAPLPAHCEVVGRYAEHAGLGGPYHTGFRMRLPQEWNQRFLFQGGGGSNGVVGDATGFNGSGNPSAVERGYAVIAQDSGHDNARNSLADHGGELVFGHDPVARANYGHASLKPTYDLAQYLIRRAYGTEPRTKIFWGCSKGGQEGMAFAQRYPDAFDGIVAMAPGMSLPRAALAQAWNTQAWASLMTTSGVKPDAAAFKSLFSPGQLALVADASLAACDGDDGARDGVIGAVGQCTTPRVLPELHKRACGVSSAESCLKPAQIDALVKVMDGVRDSSGRSLYAPFAWDVGIAAPGWAIWQFGREKGPTALNISLGGASLAAVFMTPPTALASDPAALLSWQLALNFDGDAQKIYAVHPPFSTSAWQDVGMRSTDLSAFRRRGGKLIVPHGVSDPVFSVLDTIDWWQELNRAQRGKAADFARVFPVPGMNHCSGGPATDRFDSLSALENWVTAGKAPDQIPATASKAGPIPAMPLCAYPGIAMARGGRPQNGYQCGIGKH